ncbi:MAG: hypothetical protein ACRDPK_13920 [Carbonactinosporaceae bacterium]
MRRIALALLALAIASGCGDSGPRQPVAGRAEIALEAGGGTRARDHPDDAVRHRAYALRDAVRVLRVRTLAGRIEVVGTDADVVDVVEDLEYDDVPPRTRHRLTGGTLTLGYSCPERNDECGVTYRVRVPSETSVQLRSQAGGVHVEGLSGPLQVAVAVGPVTAERLRSPDVGVRSQAGSVQLGFAAAPESVTVDAIAGAVILRVPGGMRYAVEAQTAAGITTVEVPTDRAAPRRIRANSTTGSIEVLTS